MSKLTGVNGRITFAYYAIDQIENFHKPIAAGARLDLHAMELADDDEAMMIVSASSSDPTVISVAEIEPLTVVLRGESVGSAQIEVTARDRRGNVLTDAVHLSVRTPTSVHFAHSCTDGEFAVYPAHSQIAIPFGMREGSGRPAVGYGFHPFRITPSAAMRVEESRSTGSISLKTGKPRHRVALRSKIDDEILGLALAAPGDVDGIRERHDEPPVVFAGEETVLSFLPMVAGVPFCQSSMTFVARSRTPEVCDATTKWDESSPNRSGLVRVAGRTFGICEVEVSLPDALDGNGVTTVVEVPVAMLPDGSHRAQWTPPPWLPPLAALLTPICLAPLLLTRRHRKRTNE